MDEYIDFPLFSESKYKELIPSKAVESLTTAISNVTAPLPGSRTSAGTSEFLISKLLNLNQTGFDWYFLLFVSKDPSFGKSMSILSYFTKSSIFACTGEFEEFLGKKIQPH